MQVSEENQQQQEEGNEAQISAKNTPPATGACKNREPADKFEAKDDVSDGMVEH